MKISDRGLNLIKLFEGYSAVSYPDPQSGGKPYTVGYGSTRHTDGTEVSLGETISREYAEELLRHDCLLFERWVNNNVKVELTQGQFDALVSFVYNLGPTKVRSSTAWRRLNQGDYDGCAKAMLWWISPGTSVEQGLRRRRLAEVKLFKGE